MHIKDIPVKIAVKDFNKDAFVRLALEDEQIRNEIIRQMISNPDIMVYYHCYEVVSRASQLRPELFYKYWSDIAPLLDHQNSYHRDFALTILANLCIVDEQDLFNSISEKYLEHINDEKFCTGQYCVRNCGKIIKHKPELMNIVLDRLLDLDARCDYPVKQTDLLKFNVLEILDQVYAQSTRTDRIHTFIRGASTAVSPKTRKKAKQLIEKYKLQK